MAVNGNFFKLCNMIGIHRNLLSSRIILPIYQPVALKRTVEEHAGLPSKPKKPLSPYFQFIKDLRPQITTKNPSLNMMEITKLLAQEWQKADEKIKQELRKKYESNVEKYRTAIADYKNSFTVDQQHQLEKAKLEMKHAKAKRAHKKLIRSLGKPKRPPVASSLWITTLGVKRGTMKISEWRKSMVPKWESLPLKEREVFEVKAAEAMNVYRNEMKKWQEKMIKNGNHDLIKYGTNLNKKSVDKKESKE